MATAASSHTEAAASGRRPSDMGQSAPAFGAVLVARSAMALGQAAVEQARAARQQDPGAATPSEWLTAEDLSPICPLKMAWQVVKWLFDKLVGGCLVPAPQSSERTAAAVRHAVIHLAGGGRGVGAASSPWWQQHR